MDSSRAARTRRSPGRRRPCDDVMLYIALELPHRLAHLVAKLVGNAGRVRSPLGVGDVGPTVIRDRQTLAKEGVVVALMQIDKSSGRLVGKPDLISRGFVFAKEHQPFLDQTAQELQKKLAGRLHKGDGRGAQEIATDFLERFFFEETGRRPMILPVVVEV